jgi:hypothetical protein
MNDLQEIIRTYIQLGVATPSGWHTVRCLVCNDHANKKRGGFKFEGDKVGYHCFNCPARANYDPNFKMSDAMKDVLAAFGVPEEVLNGIILKDLAIRKGLKSPEVKKESVFYPKEVQFPSYFERLKINPNDSIAVLAEEHLQTMRAMSLNDYPFYTGRNDGTKESKQWVARLIIPFYHQEKLIFYQGRDLLESSNRLKYLSLAIPKGNVMYGMDEIHRKTDDPLYIVEGFFDAFHLGGIAVLGNELSAEQIKILNRTPRKKIVLPDRKGDGHLLAIHGMRQGWHVGMPEIGNCKDICEAIVKYGKLYVRQSIIENTFTDVQADVAIRLFCEKTKGKSSKNEVRKTN